MIEKNGEPSCAQPIDEWYRSFHKIVYFHIKEITTDVHEQIEDFTSETFKRACESLKGRSEPIDNPKKWLLKIAENVVNAAKAREKKVVIIPYPRSRNDLHDEEEEIYERDFVDDSLESETERREVVRCVQEGLKGLPEEQYKAITLHYIEELSFPEISKRVQRGKSTVEKDARIGLAQLRVRLGHIKE